MDTIFYYILIFILTFCIFNILYDYYEFFTETVEEHHIEQHEEHHIEQHEEHHIEKHEEHHIEKHEEHHIEKHEEHHIEKHAKDIIKLYVIHLERSIDRIPNIETQQSKTSFNIQYFNAVDANELDKEKLIEDGIVDRDYGAYSGTGHYACFLSHQKLIKEIADKDDVSKYTIIFEDDFDIISDNFDNAIINIINDLESIDYEFDMVFLGNFNIEEEKIDKKIINNIYTINHESNITTEAYIINNKSAKKLYELLDHINLPLDYTLKSLRDHNEVKALIVNPYLVTQIREYESLIG
jgi:GR25 family glycosyltransferase involved in LPS biosynthesis